MRRLRRHGTAGVTGATLVAAVLLSLFVGAPATAFEDGGGRSIFAFGAGNRALAMGGAFAAVSDDASAAIWNPGGLGLLQRREIQVSHTNLFGLGFSEQYLAVALPDWRRGTFALFVRKFGVDGIEGRDDRNVLIDENLEDSETEISLGYGRALTDALTVGGAFKLQRQSLAGADGSGLGLDLGCLLRPLRLRQDASASGGAYDWTVGLALRNLVEPAIQLDTETVPDPRAVRFGSALGRTLSPDLGLLAAFDLEKTSGMDSRFHLGVEADYRSLLAIRLGANAGMLTAGLGVVWRDIGVDIAFEDNPLGSVQRIGISFVHGPTIGRQREQALAEAEDERRHRMAVAFSEENRRRIADLMEQATTARESGDDEAALDVLGMARVLAPEHAGVAEMQLAILRDQSKELEVEGDLTGAMFTLKRLLALEPEDADAKSELARIRAASDERSARSSEIRQLFDEAMDAFATGDLPAARTGFAGVVEREPGDREANAMLRRVAEASRLRAHSLVQQAKALTVSSRFDEAEALLGEARVLDPGVDGLAKAADLISQGRQEALYEQRRLDRERARSAELAALGGVQPAPAGTSSAKGKLTEAERRELSVLYQRGTELMEQGQSDEALRHWELVWSADPGFEMVAGYLQEEYLNRGMEAYSDGRLEEAVAIWENALRVAPDDQRTRGYLDRARQQLARIRELKKNDAGGGAGGAR